MESRSTITLLFIGVLVYCCYANEIYIVYMGASNKSSDLSEISHSRSLTTSHHQILVSAFNSTQDAKDSLIYSYTRAINGFAARLTPEQAAILRNTPGVISVFESKNYIPQTTRSWNFLGLEDANGQIPTNSLWKSTFGQNIIIGVLDSGVWPESASFNDQNMGTPPAKWKGACSTSSVYPKCNKKVIGARTYSGGITLTANDSRSPRDTTGHGTHVASIAGGAYVNNANYMGFANGIAKGGAPGAFIANYKNCWEKGCTGADTLKALDDAIADGVDVINYSQGYKVTKDTTPYFQDPLSIGAFHAIQKGIVVVAAAGNSGPVSSSVKNTAPWVTTVAASGIDRRLQSNVVLGDGSVYPGTSMTAKSLTGAYPLVYGGDIPARTSNVTASSGCLPGSLDPAKAKGKIILCDPSGVVYSEVLPSVGAVGVILANNAAGGDRAFSLEFDFPGTEVSYKSGDAIKKYLHSVRNPTAIIQPTTTVLGYKPAPVIGVISSQGPNPVVPDILKPDITAPGIDIIAAWSEAHQPPYKFKIVSGTSMASPHVAGVSALLRALHPDWSPAAIKSALMTTAYTQDNTGKNILDGDMKPATTMNFGSGFLNPNGATDPGLVYDASEVEYLNFLCDIGYTTQQIRIVSGKLITCSAKKSPSNLNYPSVTISSLVKQATVTRTLTSVSDTPSTYDIYITRPQGVTVSANPTRLAFSKKGEKKSFTLTFTVESSFLKDKYVYGEFMWYDGVHNVRSPLTINALSTMTMENNDMHATV